MIFLKKYSSLIIIVVVFILLVVSLYLKSERGLYFFAVEQKNTQSNNVDLVTSQKFSEFTNETSPQEAEIMNAVVRVKCPYKGQDGKYYYGSGFVLSGSKVITAAHVLSKSSSDFCEVIFPVNKKAIFSVSARIRDFAALKDREVSTDWAIMDLPPLPEDKKDISDFFKNEYPRVNFPVCSFETRLGDKVAVYGYLKADDYLSKIVGTLYAYSRAADVDELPTDDAPNPYLIMMAEEITPQTYKFDEYIYLISKIERDTPITGASGGLLFDETHQCVLGLNTGSKLINGWISSVGTWFYKVSGIIN